MYLRQYIYIHLAIKELRMDFHLAHENCHRHHPPGCSFEQRIRCVKERTESIGATADRPSRKRLADNER